jgi:hypothetical protein
MSCKTKGINSLLCPVLAQHWALLARRIATGAAQQAYGARLSDLHGSMTRLECYTVYGQDC